MAVKWLSKRVIYKLKSRYSGSKCGYCIPVESGSYSSLDVWLCDKQGNVDPGYNVSGVPVFNDQIGPAVADAPTGEE